MCGVGGLAVACCPIPVSTVGGVCCCSGGMRIGGCVVSGPVADR